MNLWPRWFGTAYPKVGEYLASDRPRYAYRIVAVRVIREYESNENPAKLDLEVIRISASHLPPNAVVHPFKWDSRSPKKDRHTPAI